MSAKEAAEKILACPFCGTPDDLDFTHGTEDREGIPTAVTCATCGATGPWSYCEEGSTKKPIRDWNSRAYAPKLAEIRGMIDRAYWDWFNDVSTQDELDASLKQVLAVIDGLMGKEST